MRHTENSAAKRRGAVSAKRRKNGLKAAFAFVLAVVLAATAYFGGLSALKTLYPMKFNNFVEEYTLEYDLEKSFVFAVIKCESNFDKSAVSKVNAKGLMQILPDTFEWLKTKTGDELSENMLFDPETSVRYGCLLFRILIDRFKNVETAVAAYHAGFGNVSKWLKNGDYSDDGITLKQIPYPTTARYVEDVMRSKRVYERLYDF